ncbi:MAG: T9SS type A sorting domain-containing protein, partial [Candidatus Marinimicrobia bacterium]|nr:T9SS type A sorting domain-containing protein [Candidatus Neomarinimicrobiota bacterium]
QFAVEKDLPYVVEQQLVQINDSTYEVYVAAADSSTMAIAASLRYTVDGDTMPVIAMQFDDPAAEGDTTRFRETISLSAAGSKIDYYEILLVDDAFNLSISSFVPTAVVADIGGQLPGEFRLHQNYPNPFNSRTTIKFDLPVNTKVILKIYNILGQEVRTLLNASQAAGIKSIEWDGTDDRGNVVSSGIYLYRLETDHQIKSRKMLFLK